MTDPIKRLTNQFSAIQEFAEAVGENYRGMIRALAREGVPEDISHEIAKEQILGSFKIGVKKSIEENREGDE